MSFISVESAGDLNGDGVPDLFVGMYTEDSANATGIFTVFLNTTGRAIGLQFVNASTGGLERFLEASDRVGASLTRIADVDGDTIDDLLVGVPLHGSKAGMVLVCMLGRDGTVRTAVTMHECVEQDARCGASMCVVGEPGSQGVASRRVLVGASGADSKGGYVDVRLNTVV